MKRRRNNQNLRKQVGDDRVWLAYNLCVSGHLSHFPSNEYSEMVDLLHWKLRIQRVIRNISGAMLLFSVKIEANSYLKGWV